MMIRARNYHPGRLRPIRLIVIHTMESAEKPGTARAVAEWFAGKDAPMASAHYCIDASETITCVDDGDTAWAAPGANADGLQLEHAGRAGQGAAGWRDAYSVAVLGRSALLAGRLAARHRIPVRHLTDVQLAAGLSGFVGHDQVSRVYRRSDHTDPGAHFPWQAYLEMVPTGEDPDMTAEDLAKLIAAMKAQLVPAVAEAITGIGARNPVLVAEGTGAAELKDGRDYDAMPTVLSELQAEQTRQAVEQRRQGQVLDDILTLLREHLGRAE